MERAGLLTSIAPRLLAGQTGEPGESVCEQACILEGARMAAGWLEDLGAAAV